jgi:hypothetical protein
MAGLQLPDSSLRPLNSNRELEHDGGPKGLEHYQCFVLELFICMSGWLIWEKRLSFEPALPRISLALDELGVEDTATYRTQD